MDAQDFEASRMPAKDVPRTGEMIARLPKIASHHPAVLIGATYWHPLVEFLEQMASEGTISRADLELVLSSPTISRKPCDSFSGARHRAPACPPRVATVPLARRDPAERPLRLETVEVLSPLAAPAVREVAMPPSPQTRSKPSIRIAPGFGARRATTSTAL